MSLALWLLTVTVVITVAAHIPVRGRSFRDLLRRSEHGELRGLRLTPGLRRQLSTADIISLADDSPVTIDALCFYQLAPEIRGEHAHRYFRAAERYGDTPEPWTHLVVTLEDAADGAQALSFLSHRLGLLGIRARPLTDSECAHTADSEAIVQLRRTGRSRHVAALGRKPHLWLTRKRDISITSGPAQVIGVGDSGQTITMRPADVPHLRVNCGEQDVCELLIGTLSLGYRVGIRTSRPHYFTVALGLGAVLIARTGDDTVDVVVIDEYEPDLETGAARIIEVIAGRDDNACPTLTMGEFTWTLATARTTTQLRPLTMRVATTTARAETTVPGLAAADPVVAGRHLRPAIPEASGHLDLPGHRPGRLRPERLAESLLQEPHLPSASVRR